jgi:hypothetical protein
MLTESAYAASLEQNAPTTGADHCAFTRRERVNFIAKIVRALFSHGLGRKRYLVEITVNGTLRTLTIRRQARSSTSACRRAL